MHAASDGGLDRLIELDRRYLKGNLAIAAVIGAASPIYVPGFGWPVVFWSCLPLVSAIVGLAGLRRRMGLLGWHVLHLFALSATFVGSAASTGGLESPVFQLFPVAGLLWVTYFPEDRMTLAAAPLMSVTLIGWTWVRSGLPTDYSTLDAATTLIASLLIPLFALRLVESELLHRRRAVVDQLTGCLNRHAFASRATELQAQLERTPETVGVVVFDIDHFKRINDTHGHATGDETLVAVADAVRGHLRRFELFYRIGGEEFAVLLAGADEEESRALAEGLREAVRAVVVGGEPITISCGVTIASRALGIDQALGFADGAMYVAKRGGRDRTVVFREQATNQRIGRPSM